MRNSILALLLVSSLSACATGPYNHGGYPIIAFPAPVIPYPTPTYYNAPQRDYVRFNGNPCMGISDRVAWEHCKQNEPALLREQERRVIIQMQQQQRRYGY